MNEASAPTDEKVKKQVLEDYHNGVKPKVLSAKTGVSINTIKSWISRDKVKNKKPVKDAPKRKKDAPKKIKLGAPYGNKNAIGHGAPEQNKNAEKHGAYSSIYWDSLEEREMELIQNIDYGEEYQLERQIDLYTIRERRLLVRIQEYKEAASKSKGLLVKGITKEKGTEKGECTDLVKTEMEAVMNTIILLEKELTSVQSKKTKAIDSLIRLRLENRKLDDAEKGNELVENWIDNIMDDVIQMEEGTEE